MAPEVLVAAMRRPWQVRPTALMPGLLPAGSATTDVIVDGMNALHRYGWPDRQTWICAVRLSDGGLVVFGREGAPSASVEAAVAASCAIPGYFAPVDIGGVRYVDGGAHSLTNVGEVAGLELDLVVVSAPMARSGRRYTPGGILRDAGRMQLALEMQRVRRRAPVIVLQPDEVDERAMGLNAMDPARRGAVTRQVRDSTLRRLDDPALAERLSLLA